MPALEFGHHSVAGRRATNQDRVAQFATPFGFVVAVADGMGGHQGGEVAASIAVERLEALLGALPATLAPDEALALAIRHVSHEVRDEGQRCPTTAGMGSTIAALLLRQEPMGMMAITAHAGDSRVYFQRNGRLFCLTRDHTMIRDLVDAGALTPEQAYNHPHGHVLTRSVGQDAPLDVELGAWMLLRPGDLFLVCSDGFSGALADGEILASLTAQTPVGELSEHLVDTAIRQGSQDNVSIALVRISG